MKKSYSGSCHCGAVRFECTTDLAETSRCNCSVCAKGRFWKAIVPAGEMRVQGEAGLREYRFGSQAIRHLFCATCGIKPFGRGELDGIGAFYAINIACLDDVDDAELAAADIRYEDGRNNDWSHPPAETRHL